ncbi:fimbrial protein [Pantoea sp. MBD-2R]|uniref:fimbrial protein n=1 Tax=Pantoea sp. MBD-2R TaxID=3141540 RepID=UPI00318421BC
MWIKKTWVLAMAFTAAGISLTAQAVDDGTVRFTGTISASACSVSSVAGSGATTGTVGFGSVSSANLSTLGATTLARPFTIELNHCATGSAPAITFNGTAVTEANYTSLFATPVPGVGIRLEDAGRIGTFYNPGVSLSNTGLDAISSESVTSGTGRFNAYLVAYTAGTPVGAIDTDVTFVIDYAES